MIDELLNRCEKIRGNVVLGFRADVYNLEFEEGKKRELGLGTWRRRKRN